MITNGAPGVLARHSTRKLNQGFPIRSRICRA
jgi:hypothetical protein